MSSEPNKPLDAALDLLVFAPVGLALTAAEEIPKLAARGRATLTGQLSVAKMLGQFAITQGRREVEKRLGGRPPPAPEPTPTTTTPYADEVVDPSYEDLLGSDTADVGSSGVKVSTSGVPAVDADGLAIPGYDSLSASQVVQRLAGLSADELAAVGGYEEAHRGRRTILTRVRQLQGG